MKKTHSILLVSMLLLLAACGTGNQVQNSTLDTKSEEKKSTKEWYDYELVIPMANFHLPQSFEEIQKKSDAIVIAKTSEQLTERERTVTKDENNHTDDFYTITNIEIIDVLEQNGNSTLSKGDIVKFTEDYALMKEDEREYLLIYDNYTPLKAGSEYILVMGQDNFENNQYYHVGTNLAKFNIDQTDPYDFLHDTKQSSPLSAEVKELLPTDVIEKEFNTFSSKKDNSAHALHELYSDKVTFFQDLKSKFPDAFSE